MNKVLVLFSKGFPPSLLPVLLIGGPLVLGQDSLQHCAVQGALDAEGTTVKEVLPWVDVNVIGISRKNNCLDRKHTII